VVCVVIVDPEDREHVLGLREGGMEDPTVPLKLLEDLIKRGLNPKQRWPSHPDRLGREK
jgi:hypothetical protein